MLAHNHYSTLLLIAFHTEESGRTAARCNLKRIADDETVSVSSKLKCIQISDYKAIFASKNTSRKSIPCCK